MNVLVVAAHPDDEVLGCGGAAARLAAEGCRVRIAILGEGATSRFTSGEEGMAGAATRFLAEASRKAAAELGAAGVDNLGLPDNRFDSLPLLDVVKEVERLLSAYSPALILTHSGGDVNIDHAIACRAVLTASRPLPGSTVRAVYVFETPSSSEWSFGQLPPAFQPDTFVDIAGFMPRKLAALQAYETEMRDFPHPRSRENVEALAKLRGSAVGARAAEAFQRIWGTSL